MRFALIFFLVGGSLRAQTPLQDQIRKIAADAHGKVAVACSLPGRDLNCDVEAHSRPPMQSVFKFAPAVYALHLAETGKFSLDQQFILCRATGFCRRRTARCRTSIRMAMLRELLRLASSLSDNVAADMVLRAVGGPGAVDAYVRSIGAYGFHLEDGERGLSRDAAAQYRNWLEPIGAVQLLRRLSDNSPPTPEHTQLLLG